jgi:hypothetical protein
MAIENTILITAVAAAFGSLWLYDRYSTWREFAKAKLTPCHRPVREPRIVFDERTGLYMLDVPQDD